MACILPYSCHCTVQLAKCQGLGPTDTALFPACPNRRSNNHITGWSGPYNIPAGKVLWAHLKDVTFRPKGPAFCPKPDHDLQPAT